MYCLELIVFDVSNYGEVENGALLRDVTRSWKMILGGHGKSWKIFRGKLGKVWEPCKEDVWKGESRGKLVNRGSHGRMACMQV